MIKKIRIFVSSPSDVSPERVRVERVIKRIESEYSEGVEVEIVRWEEEFYSATSTFQEQISSSAEADIVICILWKRLGSALPDNFSRTDGSSRTGTEFEFEEALEAALSTQSPDILLYRKSSKIMFDAERVEQEKAELQSLELFWRRWVQNEKGHFTAGFKSFESTDDFESVLEKDLRAWFKRRFHKVTWPEIKGSPYRGLDVFEAQHFPIYFGRRRVISEVRARLIANAERDNIGFLLIIGASGSGKSSLVRAGLIPTLKTEQPIPGIAAWRELIIRPSDLMISDLGENWHLALAQKISEASVLPEILKGDYSTPSEIAELWKSESNLSLIPVKAGLKRWGKKIAQQEGQQQSDTRLIIVLDQLEELFQWSQAQQVAFLNLFDSFSRSGVVWVVATMRSDFYPQLFALPELMALKDSSRQYDLAAPNSSELMEIINGPATAAGLTFDVSENGESLADRLQSDAETSPAALPLLEFTLQQLYSELDREQKLLTFTSYEKLGGLQGALTQTAESVFQKCSTQFEQSNQQVFANVMRELVAIGEDGKATRRIAKLDYFKDKKDELFLVEGLIEKRLLRSFSDTFDQKNEQRNGQSEAMVDITHEALIGHWHRLQNWLESDRELLQVRDRLLLEQQRWENSNKNKDLLATSGKRLQDLLFLENSQLSLDKKILEFVIASKKRAKIIKRRKNILLFSFGMISLLAGGFGVVTLSSIDKLEKSKSESSKKQAALDKTYISSAKLVAESEYSRGNALLQQGNNREAVLAYVKAMQRATQKKDEKSEPTEWVSKELPSLLLEKLIEQSSKNIFSGTNNRIITDKRHNLTAIISNAEDRSYSKLSIFDTEKNKLLFEDLFKWEYGDDDAVKFSPKGGYIGLIDSTSSSYRVYDLKQTSKIVSTLKDIPTNNISFQFLTENLIAVLADNELRVWNTGNDESIANLKLVEKNVESFSVLNENSLLINGKYLWKLDEDKSNKQWKQVNQLEAGSELGISRVISSENVAYVLNGYFDTWMNEAIVQLLYYSTFRHFIDTPQLRSRVYKINLLSEQLDSTLLAHPQRPDFDFKTDVGFKTDIELATHGFISDDNKTFYLMYDYGVYDETEKTTQSIFAYDIESNKPRNNSIDISKQNGAYWEWITGEIGGQILTNRNQKEVHFYSKKMRAEMGVYSGGYFLENRNTFLIIKENSISSISKALIAQFVNQKNLERDNTIELELLSDKTIKLRDKSEGSRNNPLELTTRGLPISRGESINATKMSPLDKNIVSDVVFPTNVSPMIVVSGNYLKTVGRSEMVFDCGSPIVAQMYLINEIACLSEKGLFKVWNRKNKEIIFEHQLSSDIRMVASNERILLANTESNQLVIFINDSEKWKVRKRALNDNISSMAINDQQIILAKMSGSFSLLDTDLKLIKNISLNLNGVISNIAVSKDESKLVVSTTDGELKVFSAGDFLTIGSFKVDDKLDFVKVTSNNLIAITKKGKVLSWIFSGESSDPVIADARNNSPIISATLSYDQQWLTIVDLDNNINIYNLNTGSKSLEVLAKQDISLIGAELSKDNWTLMAINRLGKLSSIEIGNQLFNKQQAELFKVLASNVLYRNGVIEDKFELNDLAARESLLSSLKENFFDQWIKQVSACGFSESCQVIRSKNQGGK